MKERPHIYFITGEPSGDNLGKDLIKNLRQKTNDIIEFSGIGGLGMEQEGKFKSLFPMSELTLFGLTAVLPRIPKLYWRMEQIRRDIKKKKPDIILTIDSPGFNFHLMKKLKNVPIPKIHYTAPSVWAWAPKRARKISKLYDHLFCLLPFEPRYFHEVGLSATFVGHPMAERDETPLSLMNPKNPSPELAGEKKICLLPGSRKSELHFLLPIFRDVAVHLKKTWANIHFTIPSFEKYKAEIDSTFQKAGIPYSVLTDINEKTNAMKGADLAIAASGTVMLELAAAGCPTIIAYKVNAITGYLAKKFIKIPYVSLVNILLKNQVVPEFLQNDCTVENIVEASNRILSDQTAQLNQINAFHQALSLLKNPAGPPGSLAADVVLRMIRF